AAHALIRPRRTVRTVPGDLEPCPASTHTARAPVQGTTPTSGGRVPVTHNPPLRVVNTEGFVVWREAGELREGDTLVSARFGAEEAASGSGLGEDEAVLLGYLTSRNTLAPTTSLRFAPGDDEVGGEFTAIAEWLFDTRVEVHQDDDHRAYVLPGKEVRTLVAERYDLDH